MLRFSGALLAVLLVAVSFGPAVAGTQVQFPALDLPGPQGYDPAVRALDECNREGRNALGAPQLANSVVQVCAEGRTVKARNPAIAGKVGTCWSYADQFTRLQMQAETLYEQARRVPGPQARPMVAQANSLLEQSRAPLISQAECINGLINTDEHFDGRTVAKNDPRTPSDPGDPGNTPVDGRPLQGGVRHDVPQTPNDRWPLNPAMPNLPYPTAYDPKGDYCHDYTSNLTPQQKAANCLYVRCQFNPQLCVDNPILIASNPGDPNVMTDGGGGGRVKDQGPHPRPATPIHYGPMVDPKVGNPGGTPIGNGPGGGDPATRPSGPPGSSAPAQRPNNGPAPGSAGNPLQAGVTGRLLVGRYPCNGLWHDVQLPVSTDAAARYAAIGSQYWDSSSDSPATAPWTLMKIQGFDVGAQGQVTRMRALVTSRNDIDTTRSTFEPVASAWKAFVCREAVEGKDVHGNPIRGVPVTLTAQ